jgi:hypothetical protein
MVINVSEKPAESAEDGSRTLVTIYQTTRCHNPEDRTLTSKPKISYMDTVILFFRERIKDVQSLL